jgi:cyclopropane-fatty-acyl-phospholipid synthase
MKRKPNWIDGFSRRRVLATLNALRGGRIRLEDAFGTVQIGEGDTPNVELTVVDSRFYRRVLTGGSLEAAAAYIDGDWCCDDLVSLFRLLLRNRESTGRFDRSAATLGRLWNRLRHWRRRNSRSGSRRNIAAHYDLGNDFFSLWLDPTLAYSSGIFRSPQATLHEASIEKFDRVCRKLDLKSGDHLLEIGTGWGGFAIHAAENYGCRVTTTTTSRRQYEIANKRIQAAGLSDKITLRDCDYRDLSGRFSKLASIEMIEAVGHRNFDAYFTKCSQLLPPDGSAVIQAIVMPDQRYDDYLRSADFIQTYIFPGGCLPSLSSMLNSAARASDLRLVHVEDFGLHYAETLRRWRRAFTAQIEDVRRLGYPDAFLRLWEYYLCYCEAAFDERYTSVVQLQFDKPGCRRDALGITARAAGHEIGSTTSGESVAFAETSRPVADGAPA